MQDNSTSSGHSARDEQTNRPQLWQRGDVEVTEDERTLVLSIRDLTINLLFALETYGHYSDDKYGPLIHVQDLCDTYVNWSPKRLPISIVRRGIHYCAIELLHAAHDFGKDSSGSSPTS